MKLNSGSHTQRDLKLYKYVLKFCPSLEFICLNLLDCIFDPLLVLNNRKLNPTKVKCVILKTLTRCLNKFLTLRIDRSENLL